MLKAIVPSNVIKATTKIFQSYFPFNIVAELAAEPAKLNPITTMIGPTNSAGNKRSIQRVPTKVTIPATTR